jgi:hypothetical protein
MALIGLPTLILGGIVADLGGSEVTRPWTRRATGTGSVLFVVHEGGVVPGLVSFASAAGAVAGDLLGMIA